MNHKTMKSIKLVFLLHIISTLYPCNNANAESPCGDWEPYKDEKCIKIFYEKRTNNDAIKLCKQQKDSVLISVRSMEEQQFFYRLLFGFNTVVDAVWIGAKNINNEHKWADNSDLTYSNWAYGRHSHESDKACVEMMAEGSSKGEWVSAPCNKKNLVVCEKMQTWTMSKLQKIVLNLMNNPVPVGFIYVQLPYKPEPSQIWPMVGWKDVSSTYSGHFFRVEGGNAEVFGLSQEDSFQRHQTRYYYCNYTNVDSKSDDTYVYNARINGNSYSRVSSTSDDTYCFNMYKSHADPSIGNYGIPRMSSETRPINYSVRIWERTGTGTGPDFWICGNDL